MLPGSGFGGKDLAHLYAIADLHLSNDPACGDKSMDVFGGAWEGHDKRLRDIWLRLIEPEDTVIIAGDISWALKLQHALADLEWIDSLPGTKLLLRGNHDLWWTSLRKMNGRYGSIRFLRNDSCELEDCVVCGTRGWICPGEPDFSEDADRKIYEREVLRLEMSLKSASQCGKEIIAAMHFPPMNRKLDSFASSSLSKSKTIVLPSTSPPLLWVILSGIFTVIVSLKEPSIVSSVVSCGLTVALNVYTE